MNCLVEDIRIGEGLMGEIVGLEIMPDGFDVIEFGCIFRQPFGGEPVGALGKSCQGRLARVDRTVVEHDDSRLDLRTGFGTIELIERLEMHDEVGAALGWRGGDGQLALLPIKGLSGISCVRPVLSLSDEPFAEDDSELGLGLVPFTRRSFPLVGRTIEHQI